MNLPIKIGQLRKCLNCETSFRTGRKHNGKKYCSRNCWRIHWKGKNTHMFGKSLPKSTLQKLKGRWKEEKNPNWKGGISSENHRVRDGIEMGLWREAVFARDNWTCQKTGIKGGTLHAHHIQNFADFPELRFAIDNGITLNKESHMKFHKKYGKRNNTIKQLLEYLN